MQRETSSPAPNRSASPLEGPHLFSLYGERVYRFCLRLCYNRPADAEDLAQDVLVAAWQSRESFKGHSQPITYLFRIALNRAERLRSQQKETSTLVNEPQTGAESDPLRQTVARVDLARPLDTLPDPLRQAFVLVKVQGLRYREAATILQIPQGTVQYHVHEATLRLRTALADTLPQTTQAQTVQGQKTPEQMIASAASMAGPASSPEVSHVL